MNANELADAMEIRASIRRKATSRKSVTEGANDRLADQLDQAATMLRKQQSEIESMQERMIVSEKELNHMRSFFGCDPAYYGMTNAEPVAWMPIQSRHTRTQETKPDDEQNWIPLYLHPAKTLSIGEIHAVWAAGKYYELDKNGQVDEIKFTEFAYAILRKAQEK